MLRVLFILFIRIFNQRDFIFFTLFSLVFDFLLSEIMVFSLEHFLSYFHVENSLKAEKSVEKQQKSVKNNRKGDQKRVHQDFSLDFIESF